MGRHRRVDYDDARDRLFTEICRCQVLEADDAAADEWLDDTVEYLAQEYPSLTRGQVRTLHRVGHNYVAPAIPYGEGMDATNRDEWCEDEGSDPPTD